MALTVNCIKSGFEILIGTAIYRAGAGGIVLPAAVTERLGYDIDRLAWDLRVYTIMRWGNGTTMHKAILHGYFAFDWKPQDYTPIMYWDEALDRECEGWMVG